MCEETPLGASSRGRAEERFGAIGFAPSHSL